MQAYGTPFCGYSSERACGEWTEETVKLKSILIVPGFASGGHFRFAFLPC
jgi:hypothetical protein